MSMTERHFVLALNAEEYNDLSQVVFKAREARIRPAVKVSKMLQQQ
jgi:DNA-binding protein